MNIYFELALDSFGFVHTLFGQYFLIKQKSNWSSDFHQTGMLRGAENEYHGLLFSNCFLSDVRKWCLNKFLVFDIKLFFTCGNLTSVFTAFLFIFCTKFLKGDICFALPQFTSCLTFCVKCLTTF